MRFRSEMITPLSDSVVNMQNDLDMNVANPSGGQMRFVLEPSSE